MSLDLKGLRFCVGMKQSTEAVKEGLALRAYVADDADFKIAAPFKALCLERGVEVFAAESKKMLGKACGIKVSAACAVILK